MNVEQIKKIGDLIPLNPGSKIKSHSVKRLTAPGENYGSLMLSVDISVETPNRKEEIRTVAKLIPPNEFIQEVFNTQVTFRNEIAFFRNIMPLLQNFQREHEVKKVADFAAKYYGSRLNLNKDDDSKVDDDAALVLENLKVIGYDTLDRIKGLDLDAAKLVIINLAELHAIPLALRLQKPEVFEKEIAPYLDLWQVKEHLHQQMKQDQIRIIDEIPELEPLRERILAGFDRAKEQPKAREPFATVVHNDCWTNNNMFKMEGNKVVKSKMVDFQILNYGSPAKDVVFFIFSSVKNEVVKSHYEELVKLYYDTFIATLKELHCDTAPFTWDTLQKEIDHEAKYSQIGHVAFMLLPIYAPKGTTQELSEFTPDTMKIQEITDVHKKKYVFIYTEFAKRGWI